MRVVQVANFYGPRSGGLRTAVDRLGAEYCASGHEVFLIVPGARTERHLLRTGVVRITLPAKHIPYTGGYRAVMPGAVRTVLETLRPDALEVSDRLTLRSLGRWGREHGVTTVMISHERLDRFAGQLLPRRAAQKFADFANARTAANYDTVVCTTGFAREEFDRIGATNTVTVPLGVDLKTFHPRRRCARVRQHWATPTQILLVHCGRLSVEKHATAASTHSPHCVTPASTLDWSSLARVRCAPGWNARQPGCRSTSPVSSRIGMPSLACWHRPMSHWHLGHTRHLG